jgi:hypothetical protein
MRTVKISALIIYIAMMNRKTLIELLYILQNIILIKTIIKNYIFIEKMNMFY